MPVMDSFEATSLILNMTLKKEIPRVSLVAITANSSPMDQKKCLDSGMTDFLLKPFKKIQIREIINKIF